MFTEIRLRISQTVLRLHRQHGDKLNHQEPYLALWVTQDAHESVLMIIRTEHGTLFSLRGQGAAVTTKTPKNSQQPVNKKIMNAPIISADAKARLTEAGKKDTPPAPE